ncbi:hypothetical protein OM076_13670 [Solirubrobacter ginsenosidimutans]|uniref:Uncharacterized protein n=1 Tax=Solirubrobacter ginsenosidimutans TaxID=490573 RepID=A0A9X3MT17_9ACTN|nr:hypothetical protein [Solirubrobacter ginsenosidimutans]MDA0161321.1 hypothetical protein [Solirubrobacter ginsenosidimutans]
MLTYTERQFVTRALEDRIALEQNPRAFMGALVGDGEFLRKLRYCQFPGDYASDALHLAETLGSRYLPPWLVRLIAALPETDEIAALLEHLRSEGPSGVVYAPSPPEEPEPAAGVSVEDAIDARRLAGNLPFVDRYALRHSVRRLLDDARVLIVNGPPRSGKTYTVRFLSHVGQASGAFGVAHVELPSDMTPVYGPVDLAADLVARMGRDTWSLPQVDEEPARAARTLSRWTLSEVPRAGGNWWLALDGFGAPDFRDDTLSFIRQLARDVATLPGGTRLVLIDFPGELAGVPAHAIEFEELPSPSSIGTFEVDDFFKRLFERLPGEFLPDAISAATVHVMNGLPEDDGRLERMAARLRAASDALERAAEA